MDNASLVGFLCFLLFDFARALSTSSGSAREAVDLDLDLDL